MIKFLVLFLLVIGLSSLVPVYTQEVQIISIHQEQGAFYRKYSGEDILFFDSLNGFRLDENREINDCRLERRVFGYYPYWSGSAYLNFRWNLLSDLCYFSYEVNPSNGEPSTIHDWHTDPAIDSALANDVRVHLCVTLFSGHATFFSNPAARQALIDNLILLIQQRSAHGINLDFEAVPLSQANHMTSFVADLHAQMEAEIPDADLSMAIPAINWNGTFDIPALRDHLDFFMVMGYDYYWNGSADAGPVTPLYTLTLSSDYSLARTIADYLADGISPDKFVLGIPYYGRQWKTKTGQVPSQILANGVALTYANIRNNGGTNYSSQNFIWEPKSFSSAYIFFQNGSWNQCFIGLDRDARKWYDQVNYNGLAGIGIWALGYDNGYPDLWQAISDKFTDCYIPLVYDSLYDAGGPAWNYYPGGEYVMTIDHRWNDNRYLTFMGFNLEDGYDSLVIFAGTDTTAPMLAVLTGEDIPGTFSSPTGEFTMKFHADNLNQRPGWMAVYHNGSLGMSEKVPDVFNEMTICPNPSSTTATVRWTGGSQFSGMIMADAKGSIVLHKMLSVNSLSLQSTEIDLTPYPPGIYTLILFDDKGQSSCQSLLIY